MASSLLLANGRTRSGAAAAAYAGLSPREFRAGAGVRRRTRLSQAGDARLRKALFLPTQTAIRFNSLLRGFFARLAAAGKAKRAAVGACMRKPAMVCCGALKNREPFDPGRASRMAP
jgi:transposase